MRFGKRNPSFLTHFARRMPKVVFAPSPEEQAAVARAEAEEQAAKAAKAMAEAQKLMRAAKEAEAAAQAAQLEAETKARAAHFVTARVDAYPIGGGGKDAVVALCGKLMATPEEMRVLVTLKADRRGLGMDGAAGLAYLLAGGALGRLEVLSLACNALGSDGAALVADALSNTTPLQQLDLASNSIGELGAASVARALARGAAPRLARLSLKNNDIGDDGAAALAASSHGALEWLNLGDNQVADEGTAALADALLGRHFPRLRRLSLDHNQLDDGAMASLASALQGATALEEVYLESNPASDEATRRVQRLLPAGDGCDEAAPPPSGRDACQKLAVSLHQAGCVCQ